MITICVLLWAVTTKVFIIQQQIGSLIFVAFFLLVLMGVC